MREGLVQQSKGEPFRREPFRHVIRDAQRGTVRERIGAACALLLLLSWFLQIRRRRKLRRRYVAEVLLDPGLDLVGGEVACDDERRVVRSVKRLEERADLVDRGCVEVNAGPFLSPEARKSLKTRGKAYACK